MVSEKIKVLICGATGKVGRELVRLFVDGGNHFCVLVRNEQKAREFEHCGIEARVGDLTQPTTLPAVLDGIDRLYLVYPDRPDRITAEQNLIDAAKLVGVRHIVKQSAFGASLKPPVSFGIALAQTDQYLMESGLEWTLLRPYFFMQNFLDVAKVVADRGLLPMPFGHAKVGFIDCRDIAAVAWRTLVEEGHSGKTYYLSGPESMDFDQVALLMSGVLKRKVTYLSPPFFIARLGMKKTMSNYELALLKPLIKMLKEGGEETLFTDVERICQRKPIDFKAFIRDHIEAFTGR